MSEFIILRPSPRGGFKPEITEPCITIKKSKATLNRALTTTLGFTLESDNKYENEKQLKEYGVVVGVDKGDRDHLYLRREKNVGAQWKLHEENGNRFIMTGRIFFEHQLLGEYVYRGIVRRGDADWAHLSKFGMNEE